MKLQLVFVLSLTISSFNCEDQELKKSNASEVVAKLIQDVSKALAVPVPLNVTLMPCFSSRNCMDPGMVCKYVNGTSGSTNQTDDGRTVKALLPAQLTGLLSENPDPSNLINVESYDLPKSSSLNGTCICDNLRKTECKTDFDCKAIFGTEVPCQQESKCLSKKGQKTGFCRMNPPQPTTTMTPISSSTRMS